VFYRVKHFNSSLIFWVRLGAYSTGALLELAAALLLNIRLGSKCLKWSNSLAYFGTKSLPNLNRQDLPGIPVTVTVAGIALAP
jgi:hypothetical protein